MARRGRCRMTPCETLTEELGWYAYLHGEPNLFAKVSA